MKLSWSHKLFFRINAFAARDARYHVFFIFCAKYMIFVLFVLTMLLSYSRYHSFFWDYIAYVVSVSMFGLCISYFFALVWRHPRVYTEFTETKVLLRPLFDWKSFPSDHTFLAFVLAGSILFFGSNYVYDGVFAVFESIVTGILIIIASAIGVGRIVVGVHYPRDILGGMVLALVCLFFLQPTL